MTPFSRSNTSSLPHFFPLLDAQPTQPTQPTQSGSSHVLLGVGNNSQTSHTTINSGTTSFQSVHHNHPFGAQMTGGGPTNINHGIQFGVSQTYAWPGAPTSLPVASFVPPFYAPFNTHPHHTMPIYGYPAPAHPTPQQPHTGPTVTERHASWVHGPSAAQQPTPSARPTASNSTFPDPARATAQATPTVQPATRQAGNHTTQRKAKTAYLGHPMFNKTLVTEAVDAALNATREMSQNRWKHPFRDENYTRLADCVRTVLGSDEASESPESAHEYLEQVNNLLKFWNEKRTPDQQLALFSLTSGQTARQPVVVPSAPEKPVEPAGSKRKATAETGTEKTRTSTVRPAKKAKRLVKNRSRYGDLFGQDVNDELTTAMNTISSLVAERRANGGGADVRLALTKAVQAVLDSSVARRHPLDVNFLVVRANVAVEEWNAADGGETLPRMPRFHAMPGTPLGQPATPSTPNSNTSGKPVEPANGPAGSGQAASFAAINRPEPRVPQTPRSSAALEAMLELEDPARALDSLPGTPEALATSSALMVPMPDSVVDAVAPVGSAALTQAYAAFVATLSPSVYTDPGSRDAQRNAAIAAFHQVAEASLTEGNGAAYKQVSTMARDWLGATRSLVSEGSASAPVNLFSGASNHLMQLVCNHMTFNQ